MSILRELLRNKDTIEMGLNILENTQEWDMALLPAIRELESAVMLIRDVLKINNGRIWWHRHEWSIDRTQAIRKKALEKGIITLEEYEAKGGPRNQDNTKFIEGS